MSTATYGYGWHFTNWQISPPPREFGINRLPAKLISNVCEHMDDQNPKNCRLTSRKMAEHARFAYGTRFFSCIVFLAHSISLDLCLRLHEPQRSLRMCGP
jgi:hypothetical protein